MVVKNEQTGELMVDPSLSEMFYNSNIVEVTQFHDSEKTLVNKSTAFRTFN